MNKSPGSVVSRVVIFSKVAAFTSQPVAFNRMAPMHSWTSDGPEDRPQQQASEKADQSTFGSGVVVIQGQIHTTLRRGHLVRQGRQNRRTQLTLCRVYLRISQCAKFIQRAQHALTRGLVHAPRKILKIRYEIELGSNFDCNVTLQATCMHYDEYCDTQLAIQLVGALVTTIISRNALKSSLLRFNRSLKFLVYSIKH